MKSVFALVLLSIFSRALASSISLQLCHSHCNIGEVDCILQCPHIYCEQDCTRAEQQCIQLCDGAYTTVQTLTTTTSKPHGHTESSTAAPTTKETRAPSTSAMQSTTIEVKPTPKPHHPPTTTVHPMEILETTTDPSGVVIIG